MCRSVSGTWTFQDGEGPFDPGSLVLNMPEGDELVLEIDASGQALATRLLRELGGTLTG